MEESFAKLEADLREQLERTQQELKDTMIKAQQEMLNQIAQISGLKAIKDLKEEGTNENPVSRAEGLLYPPDLVIDTSSPLRGAPSRGGGTTSHQTAIAVQALPSLDKVKEEFSK